MTRNAKIISAIAGLALVAVVGMGVAATQAASDNGRPNFMAGLATALAQKFNLNAGDVQNVISEQMTQQRAQMQEQREEVFGDRLAKAVADGKLTQAQADLILAEKAKVQAQIEALEGKTGSERQAAMKQIMDAAKQWATDNNISQGYMMFGFGGPGKGKGFGLRGVGAGCPCQNGASESSD